MPARFENENPELWDKRPMSLQHKLKHEINALARRVNLSAPRWAWLGSTLRDWERGDVLGHSTHQCLLK
jgi:hypothetical protein